ncbi:MAG: transglycosylase domain-containing protein [Candidatus Woesearchaeota archaeon]|nr:MAG: transglycosylase domain-containing protein [Candidatus Woesearchaeota archaeon]
MVAPDSKPSLEGSVKDPLYTIDFNKEGSPSKERAPRKRRSLLKTASLLAAGSAIGVSLAHVPYRSLVQEVGTAVLRSGNDNVAAAFVARFGGKNEGLGLTQQALFKGIDVVLERKGHDWDALSQSIERELHEHSLEDQIASLQGFAHNRQFIVYDVQGKEMFRNRTPPPIFLPDSLTVLRDSEGKVLPGFYSQFFEKGAWHQDTTTYRPSEVLQFLNYWEGVEGYSLFGIDLPSLVRGLRSDSKPGSPKGSSTIVQQLMRLGDDKQFERDYGRKLEEITRSVLVADPSTTPLFSDAERTFAATLPERQVREVIKYRLLELALNNIPFGLDRGVFSRGLAAASLHHFGRTSPLSETEMMMLLTSTNKPSINSEGFLGEPNTQQAYVDSLAQLFQDDFHYRIAPTLEGNGITPPSSLSFASSIAGRKPAPLENAGAIALKNTLYARASEILRYLSKQTGEELLARNLAVHTTLTNFPYQQQTLVPRLFGSLDTLLSIDDDPNLTGIVASRQGDVIAAFSNTRGKATGHSFDEPRQIGSICKLLYAPFFIEEGLDREIFSDTPVNPVRYKRINWKGRPVFSPPIKNFKNKYWGLVDFSFALGKSINRYFVNLLNIGNNARREEGRPTITEELASFWNERIGFSRSHQLDPKIDATILGAVPLHIDDALTYLLMFQNHGALTTNKVLFEGAAPIEVPGLRWFSKLVVSNGSADTVFVERAISPHGGLSPFAASATQAYARIVPYSYGYEGLPPNSLIAPSEKDRAEWRQRLRTWPTGVFLTDQAGEELLWGKSGTADIGGDTREANFVLGLGGNIGFLNVSSERGQSDLRRYSRRGKGAVFSGFNVGQLLFTSQAYHGLLEQSYPMSPDVSQEVWRRMIDVSTNTHLELNPFHPLNSSYEDKSYYVVPRK